MKILNYGSCNVDYVYLLDHIVNVGETESSQSLSVFCGGKGLNQSIAIARAGQNVYHAGCIGENGEFLSKILTENGVNVDFLKSVDGENGHAIIQLSKSGENSIFLYNGSNAKITKEDIDKTLSYFDKNDIVLLQNEISNVDYIVEKAHSKGLNIIFNPSPINENIKKIDINKLSWIKLNEIEAKMITGCNKTNEALKFFKENYPLLAVVLTLGGDGSVYQFGNEIIFQPTFEVEAIDTTAAGDTFTGYFIAQIVKGKSIKNALETASCAAAISVTRQGAAPSIPKIEEVEQKLKELKPKKCDLSIEI